MYKSADNLNKHKSRGDKITHGEWNAIARAVGMDVNFDLGASDESSRTSKNKPRQDRHWVYGRCTQPLDPYSAIVLFGADGSPGPGAGQGDPYTLPMPQYPKFRKWDKTDDSAQHWQSTIFTNGPVEHDPAADEMLYVHAVDNMQPTLLRVPPFSEASTMTDYKFTPVVGHYAGLEHDTGRVVFGKSGLIAVSHKLENEDLQWFIASRGPLSITGISEGITAADHSTMTLGRGGVKGFKRDDNAPTFIEETVNSFVVWNPFEAEIGAGKIVICVDVPSIGLVVVSGGSEGEVCETIGPFVESIDWATCSEVKKNIKLCINWVSNDYTFEKVAVS